MVVRFTVATRKHQTAAVAGVVVVRGFFDDGAALENASALLLRHACEAYAEDDGEGGNGLFHCIELFSLSVGNVLDFEVVGNNLF